MGAEQVGLFQAFDQWQHEDVVRLCS